MDPTSHNNQFGYSPVDAGAPPSPHSPSFHQPLYPPQPQHPGPSRSPAPSSLSGPINDYGDHSLDHDGLPPGAGPSIPRFYGHALEPAGQSRTSLASSSFNAPYQSSDYGSVTHLPMAQDSAMDVSHGYGYRDDPAAAGRISMEPMAATRSSGQLPEKRGIYASPADHRKRSSKKMLLAIGALFVVIAGVAIPVYFFVIRKSGTNNNSTGAPSKPSSTSKPTPNITVTGGDGSTIKADDGSTFTYSNAFGGYWYADADDPFNNAAKVNSWTPALNESWNWGVDKIYGVNLGGWLVTEPFISPDLYQKYAGKVSYDVIDEFTLSQAMAANGGIGQLEDHYKTFITEQDFAEIAGAGLNFVRLPLAFWAIDTWDGEPYLKGVSWKYFLKAVQWCRKYGIRMNLDFHSVPGSQNGWNHSGRFGQINFLNGAMGIANAERTLDYIRTLIEFVSQPQYKDVVVMFGVVNEAFLPTIGQGVLSNFYLQVHDMVRNITGFGTGNGPYLSIHDGFSQSQWANWLPGADRFALDTHTYLCFNDKQSPDPPSAFVNTPCQAWGAGYNKSMTAFGFTAAGEWSLAINDCGTYVNGVGLGTRFEGTYSTSGQKLPVTGDCNDWNDWTKYTPDIKSSLSKFALAQMDTFQNWFFWTWKIGNDTTVNRVNAPFWSYQLGLENGWMPKDPRGHTGVCAGQGVNAPFNPPLSDWQTGGGTAGTVNPQSRSAYSPWPVTSLTNIPDVAGLPTYTRTGTFVTLAGPTLTAASPSKTIDVGKGWVKDPGDGALAAAPNPGCKYPDEYSAASPPFATNVCPTGATRKRGPAPAIITPAP